MFTRDFIGYRISSKEKCWGITSGMIIREINENDLTGLLELYTELHDNAIPKTDENLYELWSEILHDKNLHIIVAEEDDRIVSSCVIVLVPNLTHNQRPFAFIENVVTAAAFRRQGLAQRCLDFAKVLAVRANCYKIMLMTGSKQDGVFAFYEKAGFNRADKTAFIQWLNP